MVYLIDMRIKYRTEDGAIWLQDDEGSLVVLTVIMNRLLMYLIEQRAQVVPRDDLLHNVWDLHGLHSSNHTLNKYLSELRKQFRVFGVTTECITTIPRIGFMFNGDVDVQITTEEQDDMTPAPKTNHGSSCLSTSGSGVPSSRLFISTAIISVVLATGLYFMPSGLLLRDKLQTRKKDIPTFLLFNYGNCPVYTTQNNSASFIERKKSLFLDLAKGNDIACLNGTSFLYHISESYLYGREGRAFISRCTSKDNEYISCLNFYWSGHESKT